MRIGAASAGTAFLLINSESVFAISLSNKSHHGRKLGFGEAMVMVVSNVLIYKFTLVEAFTPVCSCVFVFPEKSVLGHKIAPFLGYLGH